MLYKTKRHEANKVEVPKEEQSMDASYISTFIVFKNRLWTDVYTISLSYNS